MAFKVREATQGEINSEIARDYELGRRVMFNHPVCEMLANKRTGAIKQKEWGRAKVRFHGGVPCVQHQGQLRQLKGRAHVSSETGSVMVMLYVDGLSYVV